MLLPMGLTFSLFCVCDSWVEKTVLQDDEGGAQYARFGGAVCLSEGGSFLAVGKKSSPIPAMHVICDIIATASVLTVHRRRRVQ
jgi:hypothetical protein